MPVMWVVIVILFSVVNMVNKANKEKQAQQKKAAQAQPAQQKVSPQRMRPDVPATPQQKAGEREERAVPQYAESAFPTSFHDAVPLEAHMHEPEMGQEGEGTEGMDCCHEYMLSDTPPSEPVDFIPLLDQNDGEMARDLLQGVIFSEVLGRRKFRRYGGKRV